MKIIGFDPGYANGALCYFDIDDNDNINDIKTFQFRRDTVACCKQFNYFTKMIKPDHCFVERQLRDNSQCGWMELYATQIDSTFDILVPTANIIKSIKGESTNRYSTKKRVKDILKSILDISFVNSDLNDAMMIAIRGYFMITKGHNATALELSKLKIHTKISGNYKLSPTHEMLQNE